VTIFEKFLYFFKHRAGRLEQLDHSWNSSRSFIIGQVAQNNLIHLKKTAKKKKGGLSSKWLVSWFLHLSVKVVCQSTVFKTKKKKKQRFFLYLLFFINLLHKAKRKWNFPISLHSKYYKEGVTVITQFLTILF
jgi:hypothetical protein